MLRRCAALLALTAATGCFDYRIHGETPAAPVWQKFVFDEIGTWEFIHTDDSVRYKLRVVSHGTPEPDFPTHEVYRVDYERDCVELDCEDTVLFSLWWSSDSDDGVLVHGYAQDDWFQIFEPAVRVTPPLAEVAEPVTTFTGGFHWSAELEGFEPCPMLLSTEVAPSCARFTIDDGDDSWLTNDGLTGTWWAADEIGIAAFSPGVDPDQWQLISYD